MWYNKPWYKAWERFLTENCESIYNAELKLVLISSADITNYSVSDPGVHIIGIEIIQHLYNFLHNFVPIGQNRRKANKKDVTVWLTHWIDVLSNLSSFFHFIKKPVIGCAVQVKWLFSIWKTVMGRNGWTHLILKHLFISMSPILGSNCWRIHCAKSVQIWNFSEPYFPVFINNKNKIWCFYC